MTIVFVGLALIMIALVTSLVLVLEQQARSAAPDASPAIPSGPRHAPPDASHPSASRATLLDLDARRPARRPRLPKASPTHPYGVSKPSGAMILCRQVLVDLPLPPPPESIDIALDGDDEVTNVIDPGTDDSVIVLELDD